jgi:hypothetical protein
MEPPLLGIQKVAAVIMAIQTVIPQMEGITTIITTRNKIRRRQCLVQTGLLLVIHFVTD